MIPDIQRANLLVAQERYAQAADELRRIIALEPENVTAHALLAISLAEENQHAAAIESAARAASLAPDYAFAHYARAYALNEAERYADAERAAEEATRLDAEDADNYAVLAQTRSNRRRWREALAAAEQGLALDAEHTACANLRAAALVKLNRGDEAGFVLDEALKREPENSFTHANQGWRLLHAGDYRAALMSFREAMRLDPTNNYAREGIVEAMKARNPVYRIVLGYLLWTSRLSGRARWGFIIGIYFGGRLLKAATQVSRRADSWLVYPVGALYALFLIFVLSTWLASPFFDLILRLDPVGRVALTKDQVRATNLIMACIGGAAACALLTWLAGLPGFYFAALVCAMMMLPVAATFGMRSHTYRRRFAVCTIALAALGALSFVAAPFSALAAGLVLIPFFLLFVVFQWYAVYAQSK